MPIRASHITALAALPDFHRDPFDRILIAQAVAELLARDIKAKTLFTTHYHELARLADTLPGVANARLEVREEQEEVTFLYKVVPGAAQKSYGVYVAKLAGLPPTVIERAKEILAGNSTTHLLHDVDGVPQSVRASDDEYEQDERSQAVIERLVNADLLHTTPMEALVLLAELKKTLAGERG